MAQTTFSGPILAGTIKNTTGTTVGTDMKNTGQVVMAQTFAIDLSSGAIAAQASDVIIPANSQIIDCIFDIILKAFLYHKLSFHSVNHVCDSFSKAKADSEKKVSIIFNSNFIGLCSFIPGRYSSPSFVKSCTMSHRFSQNAHKQAR